jgi:hypothetical protein
MVFTIIVCGYAPCCALDSNDGTEIRVSKIAALIGRSDWCIHDLSRVEVFNGDLPRFNMPFELGLHIGARLLGGRKHRGKRALILESRAHRYDLSISDISGQDVESHGNDPQTAIIIVRNWLSDHRPSYIPTPLLGGETIYAEYERFVAGVNGLIAAHRLDPLDRLSHSDYCFIITEWLRTEQAI